MTQRFQIVPAALLCKAMTQECQKQGQHTTTEMRVDAHVAGRACQTLVLSVWDVSSSVGVNVLLGQSKVCT